MKKTFLGLISLLSVLGTTAYAADTSFTPSSSSASMSLDLNQSSAAPIISISYQNTGAKGSMAPVLTGSGFSILSNRCLSVAQSRSCVVSVMMSSRLAGSYSATLSAPNAGSVSLSGSVIAKAAASAPGFTITPASQNVTFATGEKSQIVHVTLKNTGSASNTPSLSLPSGISLILNRCVGGIRGGSTCDLTFSVPNKTGSFSISEALGSSAVIVVPVHYNNLKVILKDSMGDEMPLQLSSGSIFTGNASTNVRPLNFAGQTSPTIAIPDGDSATLDLEYAFQSNGYDTAQIAFAPVSGGVSPDISFDANGRPSGFVASSSSSKRLSIAVSKLVGDSTITVHVQDPIPDSSLGLVKFNLSQGQYLNAANGAAIDQTLHFSANTDRHSTFGTFGCKLEHGVLHNDYARGGQCHVYLPTGQYFYATASSDANGSTYQYAGFNTFNFDTGANLNNGGASGVFYVTSPVNMNMIYYSSVIINYNIKFQVASGISVDNQVNYQTCSANTCDFGQYSSTRYWWMQVNDITGNGRTVAGGGIIVSAVDENGTAYSADAIGFSRNGGQPSWYNLRIPDAIAGGHTFTLKFDFAP